jgi:hypothetical protein
MDGTDSAPGSAPAGSGTPATPSWRTSHSVVTGLTTASVVLLLLYLTGRFLWRCNKSAAATAAQAAEAAESASSSRPAPQSRCGGGVALSLLPVFVHVGGAEVTAAECAVCLAEFADGEAGRALPRCGHGFHEPCIATWLRVNTTCPLCRVPVPLKS